MTNIIKPIALDETLQAVKDQLVTLNNSAIILQGPKGDPGEKGDKGDSGMTENEIQEFIRQYINETYDNANTESY